MAEIPTLESKSGIYKIQNVLNEKVYVGSSKYLRKRLCEHLIKLGKSEHENGKLQNAWNKYGSEAFQISIIEYVECEDDLLMREQFWLDTLNCVDEGYNLLKIAGSPLGYRHTDEAKQKIGEYSTGRTQ